MPRFRIKKGAKGPQQTAIPAWRDLKKPFAPDNTARRCQFMISGCADFVKRNGGPKAPHKTVLGQKAYTYVP